MSNEKSSSCRSPLPCFDWRREPAYTKRKKDNSDTESELGQLGRKWRQIDPPASSTVRRLRFDDNDTSRSTSHSPPANEPGVSSASGMKPPNRDRLEGNPFDVGGGGRPLNPYADNKKPDKDPEDEDSDPESPASMYECADQKLRDNVYIETDSTADTDDLESILADTDTYSNEEEGWR